ncbi:hypothetical protein [Tranquillimonas alkanivorans]|uniref:Uncharacterized protein n=1 Tax=Tranquillimonas alkanivorans TaxID=441119 RepID=A0A1I5WVP3_9RHOB|nr:hypothetical protein [Tranquillimonas alkanivorans]SFQ23764.1 hypothetical protein SAMN04488047_1606 [Tranquillimonas alkanivorans]
MDESVEKVSSGATRQEGGALLLFPCRPEARADAGAVLQITFGTQKLVLELRPRSRAPTKRAAPLKGLIPFDLPAREACTMTRAWKRIGQ